MIFTCSFLSRWEEEEEEGRGVTWSIERSKGFLGLRWCVCLRVECVWTRLEASQEEEKEEACVRRPRMRSIMV